VLDACETVQRHDPWLTLHGLRLIWDRNRGGPGGGGPGGPAGGPPEARRPGGHG
jgi:hypothetical protein